MRKNQRGGTTGWRFAGVLFLSFGSVGGAGPACLGQSPIVEMRFDLGPGPVAPGYVKVLPTTVFSKERGFGFEPGSKVEGVDRGGSDPLRDDYCTGAGPFLFSVALPEGNYEVKLILGDKAGESATTVKAESRRLMVEGVRTTVGAFSTPTFNVNVRTPAIAAGGRVSYQVP